MSEDTTEAAWTLPSNVCPNPQYWTAPDNQGTEREVIELVAAFVRALQPEVVVETGTHRGFAAEAIGNALLRNGHGELWTFEVEAAFHQEAVARCAELPVHCLLRESISDWVPPAPIGFAWFDSLLPLRVPEFDHYRQWMQNSTIVGFHDTAAHHGKWSKKLRSHPHLQSFDLPTPRGVIFGSVIPCSPWRSWVRHAMTRFDRLITPPMYPKDDDGRPRYRGEDPS